MTSKAAGLRRSLPGIVTALTTVALWQVLTGADAGYSPVPGPLAIIDQIAADGVPFYVNALTATTRAAVAGWFWGNLAAVVAAVLISLVAVMRNVVLRAAVAVYCLPIVAIGPILQITFGGTVPQIILAALCVYFPTVVATDAAMRSVTGPVRQLVPAFGGSIVAELVKVRWRFGLPGLFAGLKVGAPSAFLGAIIGEYLGSERGLGVAMVSAQQSLQVERVWALAIIGTAAAGAGYLFMSTVAKSVTGWSKEVSTASAGFADSVLDRPNSISSVIGSLLGSALFLLASWQILLWVLRIDPFIGYGPVAVFEYLVTDDNAAAHRDALLAASGPTIQHSVIGLMSGGVVAILVSMSFVLVPALKNALFPVAMVFRSVPLVALTPLIALIFGRGTIGVAVVTGIVTFFPTLTILTTALQDTPVSILRLGEAYGANRMRTLVKLRMVHALPSLFTALRTSAPLAVTGALLSEWLFTGDGLGHLMLVSQTSFRIGELWSAVVLVTVYSLALYALVGLAEQVVRKIHDGTFGTIRKTARTRLEVENLQGVHA